MSGFARAVFGAQDRDTPKSAGRELQDVSANDDDDNKLLELLAQSPSSTCDPFNSKKSSALSTGQPRLGGTYTETAAVALLSKHYCVGVSENDIAIYRI